MNSIIQKPTSTRRRLATHTLAGLALLLAAGCLPVALHPFYRPGDIVALPALEGRWNVDGESKSHWTFDKLSASDADIQGTNDVLKVVIHQDKKESEMTAVPFRLDGRLWLDLQGKDAKAELEELFAISLIPGHLVCQLEMQPGRVELKFMDYEWLEGLLKKSPGATPFIKTADRIVLTGSTLQLQRFIRRHAGDTNAFKADLTLEKP